MTQQWGNQPQPGQGQQWPAPQGWNRPTQGWGGQPQGQYPQGQQSYGQPQGQYPQAYGQPPYQQGQYPPPQAQFGQPGYGQPGTFRSGTGGPGGPQRRHPLRGLLLGLVLVVAIGFFAIALMNFLAGGEDDDVATSGSGQTTNPNPTTPGSGQAATPTAPSAAGVPQPNANPPELPQPTTYPQAENWLTKNAVYSETAPVPTDCQVQRIDITSASVGDLTTHLNDLTACLWRVWSGPLERSGFTLPRPPVTVYTEPITTGCGKLDDVNAVYCAADQRIYYAKPLWKIFPSNQQRAPFVVESVLAHEFGHTIQARTGILISSMAFEQQASSADAKVYSRRLEAQADCFSGMFTEAVGPSSGLSASDLSTLKEVFYNLGDDVLSGEANIQGDHGLGRSRRTWFATGQANTLMGKCNTYSAPASSVR